MLFNAGIQPDGPYLLVTASGTAQLPELCALADFPAAVARRRGSRRVLFDLLALRPDLSPEDHIELGGHIARALDGFDRIAVVLADKADRTAADLAGARGLPVRTFDTLEHASNWLMITDGEL